MAFNPHPKHSAVSILVRLHADLGGQIEANRKEAKRLADAMKHVEAVIRLFDPDYDMRRITGRRRLRKSKWFPKPGELSRAVFDVLKAADRALTTREIALRALALKGEKNPSAATVRQVDASLRGSLRSRLGREIVSVGTGMPAKWRLAGMVP